MFISNIIYKLPAIIYKSGYLQGYNSPYKEGPAPSLN